MALQFDACVLDVERHELSRDGAIVHVEPQVFDVLAYLVEHSERVVPREELLDEIWGSRFVTDSALSSRIKAARRAVGDDGAAQLIIRTVRGRGFRLVADVTSTDEPDESSAPVSSGGAPHPRSAVIGRTAERDSLREALLRSRLVTLVGPGGVGKTTLAMDVAAAESERFEHGVVWCDWSAVTDDAAAVDALADAVGLAHQVGFDALSSLRAGIGERNLLIVADNCEHVLDMAAEVLDHLVAACPWLTVLATSRSPLAVPGEVLCPVEPLAATPAAQLFVERAASAGVDVSGDDDRELVESVCRSLDGLPLALELAAASLRSATLAEVATRTIEHVNSAGRRQRARADRHQTVHDVVAWSHDLITPDGRELFGRIWVFAGRFSIEDVVGLLDHLGEPTDQVADVLAQLVDHSMLVADTGGRRTRFRLLETLRSFAADRAGPERRDLLRGAHARWSTEQAERLDAIAQGPDEVQGVNGFDLHFAEFRAAHSHARASGDLDTAVRLTIALQYYAVHRLRDEVVSWAVATADLPDVAGHPRYVEALGCAAQGLANRGDLTRGRDMAERALAACEPVDSRAVWAYRTLSNICLYEGRLDEAMALADEEVEVSGPDDEVARAYASSTHDLALAYSGRAAEAIERARGQVERSEEIGNPTQIAWSRFCLAETLADRPELALAQLDAALHVGRSVESNFVVGVVLVSIGSTQSRLGQVDEALGTFARTIEHWRQRGDWTHQWTTLRNVAGLLFDVGHYTAAARLVGAVRNPRSGARPYGADDAGLDDLADRLAGGIGRDRFLSLEREGAAADPDDVVAEVQAAIASARTSRGAETS